MISKTQATAYLDEALGITVPSFVVDAALARVETAEPAMVAAGYSDATQTLVQTYAVALVAAAGAPRTINSQGAPSGANRSFKNDDEALSKLRRALEALDTAGTVSDIVGPDPAAAALFLVAA